LQSKDPKTTRNVLITGASRGIGRETALTLAEKGFRVWAGVRDPGVASELEKEAAHRAGILHCVRLDVTDEVSRSQAIETILERDHCIHALVNNAGIVRLAYFEDLTLEEIREIFEANLFGAMALTRKVIPVMRPARNGRIVMMSSIGGRIGSMASTGYAASKFALEGFSESLWLELAPLNIHVSIIEPGIVGTDIWDRENRVAHGARDGSSPYQDWFERAQTLADSLVASATVTPRQVAMAVHRALTEPRPALRYVIGNRAKSVLALRRVLPNWLFEKVYFGQILKRVTGGR